ncbi:sugar kinase [Mucilaginibacter arboris]|uniref:Sugar kinase n=1 Tax=Mucilaginibacter arboris TaxID=2682090 RepID=A0A7K1SRY2_9SPHI|nr:sugar kinase [Mucilaginibacter arboris]MVN20072.1 sugar kinase [Mucilaginibacter arboris]
MSKILSFGELLLRICPDTEGNWLKENSLPFYVGGAELNVATALALWDLPSAYLTALPENMLSEQIVQYLQERKVDTSAIIYQGNRIGTYYLPKGKDLKNAGVIYDRAYSSYAELQPGTIDWNAVFEDVSWFHFSAICPAITQNVADVCEEALKVASQKNIFISLDLNYRAKLWKYGKQPIEIMPNLAQYCDLIMGNVWAANQMLGTAVDENIHEIGTKENYLNHAIKTSEALIKTYPKCKYVANTFRFGDPGIQYYTTLYTDGKLEVSKEYSAAHIVDKVGSGDCFMAGLIYGLYQKQPVKEALEFATAAAYGKLFIESDATTMSADEVKKIIKNEQ